MVKKTVFETTAKNTRKNNEKREKTQILFVFP